MFPEQVIESLSRCKLTAAIDRGIVGNDAIKSRHYHLDFIEYPAIRKFAGIEILRSIKEFVHELSQVCWLFDGRGRIFDPGRNLRFSQQVSQMTCHPHPSYQINAFTRILNFSNQSS